MFTASSFRAAVPKQPISFAVQSYLPRPLAVATDDPYFIGVDVDLRIVVIELECDVCDNEGPDFIAEPICFKMTLCTSIYVSPVTTFLTSRLLPRDTAPSFV